jgi:hypothetical protein
MGSILLASIHCAACDQLADGEHAALVFGVFVLLDFIYDLLGCIEGKDNAS